MPQIPDLLEELAVHKTAGDKLEARVLSVASDKSIPLDERWNMFVASGMGRKERWLAHFSSLKNIEDDLYNSYDKRQTVRVKDLMEALRYHEFTSMHERLHTIEEFQEEVLQLGISEFSYNW
jgi:hypothetical protein